mgnify:FL=1
MNRKEIINIDVLFGRLLDRQLFPWENDTVTIYQSILESSQVETRDTIDKLKQFSNITANTVIDKIRGRAESWDYNKYLDHLRLFVTPHLRTFQRA